MIEIQVLFVAIVIYGVLGRPWGSPNFDAVFTRFFGDTCFGGGTVRSDADAVQPAQADAAPKPLMRWYSLSIFTFIVAALARVLKNAKEPAKRENPLIENLIKPPILTLPTIK